jgi:hypothetical protein
VARVSWLTDPDEEWSTDGGRPSRYATPSPEESTASPVATYASPDEPAGAPEAFGAPGFPADDFEAEDEPRSRLKLVALILGGWIAVTVVVLLVLLAVRGPNNSTSKATGTAAPVASQPTASATALATPDGWALAQSDDQTNCAAHSYGLMPAFFSKTPCTTVHRELLTTVQGSKPVVVADYVVTFDTATQAAQFNALVKADGTGNISDLLREGVKLAGASVKLSPNAAFTSQQVGSRVRVAEASYTVGATKAKDPALESVAQQAIAD